MSDKKCLCPKCDTDLGKKKNIALMCDSCEVWHCYKCLDVSEKLFKAINEQQNTSMLFVICLKCRKWPVSTSLKRNVIEEVKEKFDALSVKLEKLNDLDKKFEENLGIVKKITKVEKNVEESLKIVKTQVEVNKVNYADIVKKSVEAKEEILNVRKVVKLSAQDLYEQEERDRSVIFFNKSESDKDTNIQRNDDDLAFVKSFIKDGICISPQEIQSSFRLGFYKADDVDHKRPIKVIFANKLGQSKVVEHLYRLKNADEQYKSISVDIDRSISQRQHYKKLVVEAKEKTAASSDGKKFVVRGTNKPFITERRS